MHSCSERIGKMIHTAPLVWQLLSLESRANLASCSQMLRHLVHSMTTVLTVHSIKHIHLLDRGNWPSLSLVCTSQQRFWPSWPVTVCLSIRLSVCLSLSFSVCLELLAALDLVHSKANTADTRVFIVTCDPTQPRPPPQATYHSKNLATAFLNFSSPKWRTVVRLDLTFIANGAEAMPQLVAVDWPQLRLLSIVGCNLDAAALAHLCKGNWPRLRRLSLNSSGAVIDAETIFNSDSCSVPWQATMAHVKLDTVKLNQAIASHIQKAVLLVQLQSHSLLRCNGPP